MTSILAIQGDITTQDVDAIVNAANSSLAGGGGVDGAIHRAGGPSILDECRRWVRSNGPLPTGAAMITGAGDLPARHVIHTVGPIWGVQAPQLGQRLLADCYRNSLSLAVEHGCRSIAFPNISTGAYLYPKDEAAATAVDTVRAWLVENPDDMGQIVFVCFGEESLAIYEQILGT
jgi:O-acetyl-ADP-ribose deacetylase (regulator of RNase III)